MKSTLFFREFVLPRKSWGWFWFLLILLCVVSWLPASLRSSPGALWTALALASLAGPLFLPESRTLQLRAWPPFLRAIALAPLLFVLVLTVGVAPECRHPGVILDFLFLQNAAYLSSAHYIAFAAALLLARRQFPLPTRGFAVPEAPPETTRVVRSRQLISQAEAQQLARAAGGMGAKIRFGVLEIAEQFATLHFMLLGSIGSGKTTILHLLLDSVIPLIRPGSNRRALIYDAKSDVFSFLANFSVPVKTLHPYDRRGVAWDIAADVTEAETIGEIADIFVPQQNEQQPVFSEGARDLMAGVMQSFVELAPNDEPAWTLRDVMLATRSRKRMKIILNAARSSRHLIEKYLDESDLSKSLDASLSIALRRIAYVAAAWDTAKEKVSLTEWAEKEFILVLGRDPTREGTLKQLNSVILKRISQLLLRKEETTRKPSQSWIVVDELIRAGKLEGLNDLLHEGRSKGVAVCIGFQDVPGLSAVFGEQEAKSIMAQCGNKLFLKAGDPDTAKYAAEQLSEQEIERVRVSKDRNMSEGTSRSRQDTTDSENRGGGYSERTENENRYVVEPGEFIGLPKASWERGIWGYYDCQVVGEPFKGHVTPAMIAQMTKPKPDVPDFEERKAGLLREWQPDDLKRLGLSKYTELLSEETRPSEKASTSGWDKI